MRIRDRFSTREAMEASFSAQMAIVHDIIHQLRRAAGQSMTGLTQDPRYAVKVNDGRFQLLLVTLPPGSRVGVEEELSSWLTFEELQAAAPSWIARAGDSEA